MMARIKAALGRMVPSPPVGGWRILAACWLAVLLLLGGGAATLAWLGPPPGEVVAEAPPEAAEAPAEVAAAAVPDPPEPPPLPEAVARGPAQPGQPIPPADPALLEAGRHGPLPRISPDGRTAIRTYGRGFDRQDSRPRVGLIIGGLGMHAALTEEAIRRLPGGVTLAFSPYAPRTAPLLDQARARGMELLLALPLEPTGYPLNNPGNRALLTSLPMAENEDRLDWLLSRFTGYVGAIGAIGPMRGERFAALAESLGGLQARLHSRGLLYVDPRPNAEGPARAWGRTIDLVVDEPATRGEIELKLAALGRLAKERGSALGYAGEASPVLIDRAAAWAGSLGSRGLTLAPVSALIRRPEPAEAPAQASRAP
jgi:polysaccharide deacetylase 2 family uncharacterized protein YibQ